MVVCKCHKVRAYSDWIVDGSDILSPKCSLCFQNFSKSSDSVTRLSCLHVLHTSCLLLHLKRSSSPRGYTCPSCNSQIWPPKQQFVSSGSTLYKQIEKVVEKSYITMLDKNFDALSPLASELSPNLSNSSVASGQGISGPAISPRMVVLSSSAPLGELYKNQTAQKLMQQNFILSERNLQTEIDERNSTASAMIDIEASNPSSPEIISTKTVGSPKHKVLSRKCSFRGDKRITDYPTEECGKGSTCVHKGAASGEVLRKLIEERTLQVKEYPGFNFVGLILGPQGSTKKRLEEETGTKIIVQGMGDAEEAKRWKRQKFEAIWLLKQPRKQ